MREIGPVRFLLGDDPAAAKPYLGIARTQLGITKNLMNLGRLQQGARTVTLADGTVIRSQSVFGQDTVAITPVASASATSLSVAPQRVSQPLSKVYEKDIYTVTERFYYTYEISHDPEGFGYFHAYLFLNKEVVTVTTRATGQENSEPITWEYISMGAGFLNGESIGSYLNFDDERPLTEARPLIGESTFTSSAGIYTTEWSINSALFFVDPSVWYATTVYPVDSGADPPPRPVGVILQAFIPEDGSYMNSNFIIPADIKTLVIPF